MDQIPVLLRSQRLRPGNRMWRQAVLRLRHWLRCSPRFLPPLSERGISSCGGFANWRMRSGGSNPDAGLDDTDTPNLGSLSNTGKPRNPGIRGGECRDHRFFRGCQGRSGQSLLPSLWVHPTAGRSAKLFMPLATLRQALGAP